MTSPIPKEVAVAAAMKLPAETWEALFEPLLGDIPVEPDPEIEAAWLEEVERRMRDADESSWIPAEVVFAKLRAAASQPRPVRPPVEIDGLLLPVRDVIEACWDLPVGDRLALAERYVAREQASGTSRHSRMWLEDSARWLTDAKASLAEGRGESSDCGAAD
jgi:hypothetical protein